MDREIDASQVSVELDEEGGGLEIDTEDRHAGNEDVKSV
jgi:hypothetical protein